MRLPRFRFSVRRAMAAVAIVATMLAVRDYVKERTYNGPHTSLLRVGQRVAIMGNQRVTEAIEKFKGAEADGRWTVEADANRNLSLDGGMTGVVRVEPSWDEDSCYPSRLISVEILEGPHKGIRAAVPRNALRTY